MPKASSAHSGAYYEGYVKVEEAGLRGMITLRGDLGAMRLKRAVEILTTVEVPSIGKFIHKGCYGVAWMSPDELLILTPYDRAQMHTAELSDALKGSHHLAVDVSDARAVFTLTGTGAQEVLAKLTPVDMSPNLFRSGQIRRTRLAQVPAAIWNSGAVQIEVLCFRSVAEYVFGLLKQAAQPASKVEFF
ncbi:MAG: sarcosine oxidase subunit gamma [Paracoccaceae bacterium]